MRFLYKSLKALPVILKNLRIAYRILSKHRFFTLINIIGLSSGLAIALLILTYARYEFSYEDQNPHADRLVRITMDYLNEGSVIDQDAETYAPLGPRISREFPEVEAFARAERIEFKSAKIGEKYFEVNNLMAVDSSFFRLFSIPLLESNQQEIFRAPYEMVLSVGLATKYFGHSGVIGEQIKLPGTETLFEIVGIVADAPSNTHLKYEMLVSFATLVAEEKEQNKEENWNSNNMFTYLLLNQAGDIASVQERLKKFSQQLELEELIENEAVIAQAVKDIHLHSQKSFEPEANSSASSVYILLGVALLVIVIAIVNYINLTTAKSLDRAKEVGIKKVMGSSVAQLRSQFFTEAFLINLAAVTCAVCVMIGALPFFRTVADLPLDFTFINKADFWIIVLAILLISTFLSALFPAVILSSFRPAQVLKGKFSHSLIGSSLRKGLVIFQFAMTTFLLIQTLTVRQQIAFMRAMDLGVDIEKAIVVESPDTKEYADNFSRFRDQLNNQPQVKSVAMSSCVPGLPTSQMGSTTGINLTGADIEHNFNFYVYFIDEHFIPTLDMELLAGDNYLEESENKNNIIVNEEAIRLWDVEKPQDAIGRTFDFWGAERTIIGVLKNFHQLSAKSAHLPILFAYANQWHSMATIKLLPGQLDDQLAMVKDLYQSCNSKRNQSE